MLAGRYRIIGLLGRGGMGEVYRAEDLKLNQPVALKFLPAALAVQGAALARFHREVRVARQVSHRNVCRVYDVGETEGLNFLSMEYIKGEELSSLIKRIGRLPHDKALEIARQLCAGLAAAHDNSVLHRDLKPANVMLDGDGNVRILDFGLAGVSEEFKEDELSAGTPAYMSPEQVRGEEVSKQSDIYALGLVLYEVFTGRRAFDAKTLGELLKQREASSPTNPSDHVKDLDPLVERAILRCLENDPRARPATALQVAAMLPGGDPLAAALAAGETPSPEMVAAAKTEGSLLPWKAAALFASLLVGIGFILLISKTAFVFNYVPLEKSPEILRERSSELIKKLGYADAPTDTASGIASDRGFMTYISQNDSSRDRWEKLRIGRPATLYFWYRQSPRYLDNESTTPVNEELPARTVSGMRGVTLDSLGRLRSFYAVPPQIAAQDSATQIPDWSVLFAEAGLSQSAFRPVPSTWVPPHAYDNRTAWEGAYPEFPQVTMRIEAASFAGKPVYFQIVNPWDQPTRQVAQFEATSSRAQLIILLTIFVIVLLGSIFLALRNLRLGRGDRKGAFRLSLIIFAILLVSWIVDEHHVPSVEGVFQLIVNIELMTFWAIFFWLMYIALEPFVRRRWPNRVIGWNRLLAGEYRDPLVGREILIGFVFGACLILTQMLTFLTPKWLGSVPGMPLPETGPNRLQGLRYVVTGLGTQIFAAAMMSFIFLFVLLLLTIVLRRQWLAALIFSLIGASALGLGALLGGTPWTGLIWVGVYPLLLVWVLFRYGLLPLLAANFFFHLSIFFPMTSNFSAWYAGDFVVALVLSLALASFAFYISLGGQRLFRTGLFND
jgi:serine/threonine-protein kinase